MIRGRSIGVTACVLAAVLSHPGDSAFGQQRWLPGPPAPQSTSVRPPRVCVGLDGIERANGDRCSFVVAIAGPFFEGPPPEHCYFLITLAVSCFAPSGGVACSGSQTLRVPCGVTSEHFSVCDIEVVVQTIDPDDDGPVVPPPFSSVTHCTQVQVVPL